MTIIDDAKRTLEEDGKASDECCEREFRLARFALEAIAALRIISDLRIEAVKWTIQDVETGRVALNIARNTLRELGIPQEEAGDE